MIATQSPPMQMQVGNPKPLEPARAAILSQAAGLICGAREADYGTPADNFGRIAAGWRVILGADVTPEQVALCMAWLKIARLVNGPHHDSYVDGAGYMALAGELSNADATPIP